MSHLIFVLAGALVAGSGWLLWQGRVPPNRIMGFRLPRTLRDQQAWYQANAALGRAMTFGGVLLVVAAFAAFLVDRSGGSETLRILQIAVLVVTVLVGSLLGFLAIGPEDEKRGAA